MYVFVFVMYLTSSYLAVSSTVKSNRAGTWHRNVNVLLLSLKICYVTTDIMCFSIEPIQNIFSYHFAYVVCLFPRCLNILPCELVFVGLLFVSCGSATLMDLDFTGSLVCEIHELLRHCLNSCHYSDTSLNV